MRTKRRGNVNRETHLTPPPPVGFGTNGGMGIECRMFLKELMQTLAEKDNEPYSVVTAWLKTRNPSKF